MVNHGCHKESTNSLTSGMREALQTKYIQRMVGNYLFIPQMQGNELLAFHPHPPNQLFSHFNNRIGKC